MNAWAGPSNNMDPPAFLRSENGIEFIAKTVQRWLAENRIKTIYIDPGSPWQLSSSDIEPPKEGPKGEARAESKRLRGELPWPTP